MLDGGAWSTSRCSHLNPGNNLRYPLSKRLGRPQQQFLKREKSLAPTGTSNSGSSCPQLCVTLLPFALYIHILCMCVRASYMKLTIPTWCNNLFIIINNSYMFWASICPSSGVLGCIRFILLHMVFSTRRCGLGPEEPVCSLVHWCRIQTYTSAQDYTPTPQYLSHNT